MSTVVASVPDPYDPQLEPENLKTYSRDVQQVRGAYGRVEGNRLYACDSVSERGLVALSRATRRVLNKTSVEGQIFEQLLARIAPNAPLLTQSWRSKPESEYKIAELPHDAGITDMVAYNPFSRDDNAAVAGRAVLQERDPKLAKHLERLARDGGYSFEYHFELQDGAAKREKLRKLKYGEREHPFNDTSPNRTEIGRFIQTNDPDVVAVYREEALPVRVPWGDSSKNLTQMGQIYNDLSRDPVAGVNGTVITLAAAIDTGLLEALRKQAADDQAVAERRKRELDGGKA